MVTFRDEMFKDKFKLTSFQNATCIFWNHTKQCYGNYYNCDTILAELMIYRLSNLTQKFQ